MWPGCREQRHDASAKAWKAHDGKFRREDEQQERDTDSGSSGSRGGETGRRRQLRGRELRRREPTRFHVGAEGSHSRRPIQDRGGE
jgi:hypothetical protein